MIMAYFLFLIYVVTTLFLGTSVKQFLGMGGDVGFFSTIHYYSLPFLLLSAFVRRNKVVFNIYEKRMFLLLLIYFLGAKIIGRSANLGVCFNILVEPILMLAVLRTFASREMNILKGLLIFFFCIECGVAMYEALFNNILFAQEVDIFDYAGNIRAYSLHGHPLQNAFIVCMLSVIFLASRMKRNIRYVLFIIGFLAIFTFNTRSSIYIMGLLMIAGAVKDFVIGKGNVVFKMVGLALLIFAIIYAFNFIMNHSLGTRLEMGLNKQDGSSMARFVLVNAFFLIPLDELLLGVDPLSIKFFMYRYGLIGIENSIISLIFYCGALFSMFYFPLMFKDIYMRSLSLFQKCLIYGSLFLLLNVNNALVSDGPVLVIPALTLFLFMRKNNFRKI